MNDRPDLKAMTIRNEIVEFLQAAIADQGSPIDTGGGFGSEDVWFFVDGHEYHLRISHKVTSPTQR